MDSDNLKFVIKPSQFVNIGWFLLFAGGIYISLTVRNPWWCVGSGVLWFAKWLIIKCWSFRFHEKTIAERKGVFSVLTREIHYFRIKSVRWEQPFWLRIFGLSNVVLVTSDPLIPMLRVYATYGGEDLKDRIKAQVTKLRRESTVKEQDIHPLM
jgi:membrane protein YdbS with pleckstrin-like domain